MTHARTQVPLPIATSVSQATFKQPLPPPYGPAGPQRSFSLPFKQQPTLPPLAANGTAVGSGSGEKGGNAAAGAGSLPGAAHPYRKGVAPSNSVTTMFMSNEQYGALAKRIPY